MQGDPGKAQIGAAIIGFILFIVYLFAIFLFAGAFSAVAWISILFSALAFALTFATPQVLGRRPDVEAVFFGIPLIGLAVFYFFAQLFLSGVFVAFQAVLDLRVVFFIQLILLAAFVIAFLVGYAGQSATAQESDYRREAAAQRDIQAFDIEGIRERYELRGDDPKVIRALEHLGDTVRYSDPISRGNPAVADVDMRIMSHLQILEDTCDVGDEEMLLEQARRLELLYNERSRLMLLAK